MHVDLREHVVNRAAAWLASAEPGRITLRPDDAVNLRGPLRVRVRMFGSNTTLAPGGATSTEMSPLFSYTLRIPSGHTWTYGVPAQTPLLAALGVNAGLIVIIDPDHGVLERLPELGTSADLACDLATRDRPDVGEFFPVGCEPCAPAMRPTMPPLQAPVDIPVARGGCVRPRYFDGMFLTREDLEAEQRYHLVKNRMQNRAAGAGVVWGLDLGIEGRSVCVKPGFAWDCCGHDLVVTSPYLVEIASLVRDPAAAATLARPGPHRMHLLLEYVECPDDPRPVHGDPCSPEVTRCEMARTRETVRLRLVPPRDFDGRGPIDSFLEEVEGLPWTPEDPAPQASNELPFLVRLWDTTGLPIIARPLTDAAVTVRVQAALPFETPTDAVVVPSGLTFASGSTVVMSTPGGDQVVVLSSGGATMSWDIPTPQPSAQYRIRWKIGRVAAETVIDVVAVPADGDSWHIDVTILPTQLRPVTSPCDHEPCAAAEGEAAPLFPAEPPFLHPHPDRPDDAADPRVLELAWDYAWSWIRGNGPSPDQIDPAVIPALSNLLEAWCESLLYRGPACGAAPHGVVIGCALVEGGDLRSVEPWGGRRWSLQYGLIAHWATQIGILPPDLLMSKLAAMACCVGKLPREDPAGPPPNTVIGPAPSAPGRVRPLVDALLAGETVAPLLRGATVDLVTSLAEGLSLSGLIEGRPPWLARLTDAGVSTVGRLLAASPEALHEGVLRSEHALELGALLERAEEVVAAAARGVAGAINAAATERKLATRADLAGGARAAIEALLIKHLAEARVPAAADAVRRAVDAALGATVTRRGRA